MITLIVAYNQHRVIANCESKIPWTIKEDLQFFRKQTFGKPCIMGRKTWESLPENYRPLPKRPNIIVTRDTHSFCRDNFSLFAKLSSNCYCVSSIEIALQISRIINENVFVVGGAEVYKYCIENKLADRILASEIKGYENIKEGIFFPSLDDCNGTIFEEYAEFTVKEYMLK